MGESGDGATRDGMDELGRRFARAGPDATIVFTPHNVHVEESFAVVTAATLAGTLAELDHPEVELSCATDRELALDVRDAIRAEGIPVVGVSYGGNLVEQSVMPMDWGVLVPLWFMGGRSEPQVPAVVVSPARDRPLEEHVRVGAAVAGAAATKRVAVIASADHGHAHSDDGPYGFDPAAAEYDERVVELVRAGDLAQLLELDVDLVRRAAADSYWQLLMLHGALGDGWRAELLSYEAPTYYGMLCAAFAPR
jgi:aromatic ring-opening dioxygenase LigB subunit